jgi:hypothetical protein
MDYSFVGYTQHELDLAYQDYCDYGIGYYYDEQEKDLEDS